MLVRCRRSRFLGGDFETLTLSLWKVVDYAYFSFFLYLYADKQYFVHYSTQKRVNAQVEFFPYCTGNLYLTVVVHYIFYIIDIEKYFNFWLYCIYIIYLIRYRHLLEMLFQCFVVIQTPSCHGRK